jgi:regulator of sirC expression with transglutaminase-like and TPR domain
VSAVDERWERLVAAPPQRVSLAEGALLIAADEYSGLDIDGYLARIDDMGLELRRRLRSDAGKTETIVALNRYVFEELGFSGNSGDYYDPRNSYLNDVIERRLGIPITLSVLYIEIGGRVGLSLEGVSFPSHFLVKCTLRNGAVILDPYAGGASLGLPELQERLKAAVKDIEPDPALVASLLAPASPKDVLARVLRNLRAIYETRKEPLKALAASNRIIALTPGGPDEYRDRGELYAGLECYRAAVGDLRQYLKLRPDAYDSRRVAQRIAELEPFASRLN